MRGQDFHGTGELRLTGTGVMKQDGTIAQVDGVETGWQGLEYPRPRSDPDVSADVRPDYSSTFLCVDFAHLRFS